MFKFWKAIALCCCLFIVACGSSEPKTENIAGFDLGSKFFYRMDLYDVADNGAYTTEDVDFFDRVAIKTNEEELVSLLLFTKEYQVDIENYKGVLTELKNDVKDFERSLSEKWGGKFHSLGLDIPEKIDIAIETIDTTKRYANNELEILLEIGKQLDRASMANTDIKSDVLHTINFTLKATFDESSEGTKMKQLGIMFGVGYFSVNEIERMRHEREEKRQSQNETRKKKTKGF